MPITSYFWKNVKTSERWGLCPQTPIGFRPLKTPALLLSLIVSV